METNKIITILKQVDIKLLLVQKYQKAVLADLLYEYENERKVLNTINNSLNVVKKLYESKNKIIELKNIKQELLSFGLDENTINWALDIWAQVLGITVPSKEESNNNNNNNIKFSLGGSFTLALYNNEKIFVWGNNRFGQLGIGYKNDYIKPQEITSQFALNYDEKITCITASFRSSYLLTNQGRLFAWGNNEYGQLADKTLINCVKPMDITSRFKLYNDEKIIKISAGGFHALLLTNQGRIFAWGNNQYGQLGDGTYINKSKPVNITPNCNLHYNEEIDNIYTGLGHSLFITSLGRVFSWGNNKYGQLGVVNSTKENTPIDITRNFMLISNNEKIKTIASGALHTIFITDLGRIFTCGNNEHGQLGDTTMKDSFIPVDITKHFNTNQKIIKATAGRNFSLALTNTGKVYGWGNNKFGQLGINDFITSSTGPLDITDYLKLEENDSILEIITGATSTHVYAISSSGQIYAWGNNDYGQIGEGSKIERLPIIINIR